MADKPTKKRDLRARLGRTITPKTGGDAPVAAPPPTGSGGEAPAAPAVRRPAAPAVSRPGGGVAPPPALTAPPMGIGGVPGADLAPPPFAQAQQLAQQAQEAPSDPFAAAAPSHQQVVRLEFDDKLVSDAEVGKKKPMMIFIVASVVLAVGLMVGSFGGSTYETNKIFDRTVRDGQSIHGTVDSASRTLEAVQRHVNTAWDAANPGEQATEGRHVDYEAIEALRALEKPFEIAEFTSRNYNAFTSVADLLFQYANKVQMLWVQIQTLTAQTLRADNREELDSTAAEVDAASTQPFGAVLRRIEGRLMGSLVYLEFSEGEDGAPQILARAARGGRAHPFPVYSGAAEQEITDTPAFVLLVDGASSAGVLREQTGAFGRYFAELARVRQLVTEIVELQGQILTGLATALGEAGASVTAAGE